MVATEQRHAGWSDPGAEANARTSRRQDPVPDVQARTALSEEALGAMALYETARQAVLRLLTEAEDRGDA
ncbi:hypothetical protein ACRAWD_17720 [Caulobacter segnis]